MKKEAVNFILEYNDDVILAGFYCFFGWYS